jgi:hypothetical protein
MQNPHLVLDVTKAGYSKRYPNIKLGLGSGFSISQRKFRISDLFSWKYFWSEFWHQIKWVWQRVVRGYDDLFVWNVGGRTTQYMIRGLLHMVDYGNSLPQNERWEGKTAEEAFEMWVQMLVEIAEHFYESLEFEESEKYFERECEIEEYKRGQWELGMRKVIEIQRDLWY